ncbi:hypothetical protein [Sanguibacter suaedae]|jgi:hypothetical protein|uniref:Uncharacterized protein n=1 Tax=Sanguibacter suaedae TaxID=2795737 RepID=A0A934MAJ5_9MICO|nr:hypothetical protein [Sanguibacter suaedae]MBI9115675.1 hypothetical protein [Sanguibacter suaedae]
MVDKIPVRDMARSLGPKAVGQPITRPTESVPVQAWITDARGRDVLVTGEAVAWSPRAGYVHYADEHGREGYVWVWASAITRR